MENMCIFLFSFGQCTTHTDTTSEFWWWFGSFAKIEVSFSISFLFLIFDHMALSNQSFAGFYICNVFDIELPVCIRASLYRWYGIHDSYLLWLLLDVFSILPFSKSTKLSYDVRKNDKSKTQPNKMTYLVCNHTQKKIGSQYTLWSYINSLKGFFWFAYLKFSSYYGSVQFHA